MTYAPKIILQLPLANEAALQPFVEACLTDGVELIAVFGEGSERVEHLIDMIIVGDGSDDGRFICTSAHNDEPFEDVLNMVELWSTRRPPSLELVRL